MPRYRPPAPRNMNSRACSRLRTWRTDCARCDGRGGGTIKTASCATPARARQWDLVVIPGLGRRPMSHSSLWPYTDHIDPRANPARNAIAVYLLELDIPVPMEM